MHPVKTSIISTRTSTGETPTRLKVMFQQVDLFSLKCRGKAPGSPGPQIGLYLGRTGCSHDGLWLAQLQLWDTKKLQSATGNAGPFQSQNNMTSSGYNEITHSELKKKKRLKRKRNSVRESIRVNWDQELVGRQTPNSRISSHSLYCYYLFYYFIIFTAFHYKTSTVCFLKPQRTTTKSKVDSEEGP